jgi:hypothetical protein
LLQILFVAALDIKTRDEPTVSSINSLLSQYCKASKFCFANILCAGVEGGGAPTVRFAPVVPWAKTGPACEYGHNEQISTRYLKNRPNLTESVPLFYGIFKNKIVKYCHLPTDRPINFKNLSLL